MRDGHVNSEAKIEFFWRCSSIMTYPINHNSYKPTVAT